MMYPVKILLPYQIAAAGSTDVDLEGQVLTTAKAIFNPVLTFYNRTTGLSHLKITHIVDMAFGDDPLRSGTFTQTVVDDDVSAGNTLSYDFEDRNLDNDTQIVTRHTVTVTNLDVVTQIYWLVLYGRADIRLQLPASQEIIKE